MYCYVEGCINWLATTRHVDKINQTHVGQNLTHLREFYFVRLKTVPGSGSQSHARSLSKQQLFELSTLISDIIAFQAGPNGNNVIVTMPNSCKELRKLPLNHQDHRNPRSKVNTNFLAGDALAECLQQSDCVMVHRNKASDCLREPLVETLPLQCKQLKKGYGECKRGMVDMRKRFRGNTPVSYKALETTESSGGDKGYQLYAGRSAFAGGFKETDGNEPIPPDWREVENEQYRLQQQQQAAAEGKK